MIGSRRKQRTEANFEPDGFSFVVGMAHDSTTRELTLQERFRLLASYAATEVVPSFHYPDNSGFDALATTSNGSLGFRVVPHHFETCPRWEVDLITTISGMRDLCRKEARVVKLPHGHRALLQYGGHLVEYMIEGGAEIDVYGRGPLQINIYGFAEDKWSDPTIGLHFQEKGFHGYASERLFEAIVDGLGRQRTQGLSRLVARSMANEGEVREDVTRGSFIPTSTNKSPVANGGNAAILATASISPTTGEAGALVPVAKSSPKTVSATSSTRKLQRTLSPPTLIKSSPLATASVVTRETSPPATAEPSVTEKRTPGATTPTSATPKPARQPVAATLAQKSSPSLSTAPTSSKTGTTTSISSNASTRKASPPAQTPPIHQKRVSPTSAKPTGPNMVASTSTTTAAPIMGGTGLVAPPMVRSEAMSAPGKSGEKARPLSGAQRRKLKRFAIAVKLAVAGATTATSTTTASPIRAPTSPPASTSLASCRASAAATLREVTARAELRNAQTHPLPPRPMAVNTVQRLSPLEVLAPGISVPKVTAPGESRLQERKPWILDLTEDELTAELESRKRKSSPTQPNLRGETDNLFRRNARLRQGHDWRTEDVFDGRNYGTSTQPENYPTSTNEPQYPGRLDEAPYPRTPERSTLRDGTLEYRPSYYHDRDYQAENGRERRGDGRGLQRPIILNNERPSRFDQGGYYPGDFSGRYVTLYSSQSKVPSSSRCNSMLDYGDEPQGGPKVAQAFSTRIGGLSPSRKPVAVAQIPTKGPTLSQGETAKNGSLVSAIEHCLQKPTTYHKATPQDGTTSIKAEITSFSRAVSPPASSKYSLRATASSFFPSSATTTAAPEASKDPRTRPSPSSYSSLFYPPSFNLLPGGPPGSGSVFVAGSAQLLDGEVETIKPAGDVPIKKEKEEVFGAQLAEDGWEVVTNKKKVRTRGSGGGAQMLTRSRALQNSNEEQTQVRLRRLPRESAQVSNLSYLAKDIKPVVASRGRPTLPRQPSFVPTLSSIGDTLIDDEWTTDMDMEVSGEPHQDQGDLWELTKTRRQTKVAKAALKARDERKSKEFFKWLGQEEARLWEEFKKENGPLRIGALKKKDWVPVSGGV
ncbi:hypothetical protein P7C70_g7157, partial [Phenoliferia sp. Uapishka_3]